MDERFDEQGIGEHWRALRDDLRRRGASAETAEDVAQEALLAALNTPPHRRARLRGWLRVVTTRLLYRTWASDHRRAHIELRAAREDEVCEGVSRDGGEPSLLRRSVDDLSEPYRTVLRLRFFEDRDVAEISALLGVSEAAVYVHLKRGVGRLRMRFAKVPVERRRYLLGLTAWMRRLGPVKGSLSAVAVVAFALLVSWIAWKPSARPEPVLALGAARGAEVAPGAALEPTAPERASPRTALEGTALPGAASRPATPTVSGRVWTPDGDPAAGARVHVGSSVGAEGPGTLTDEDGRYEVARAGSLLWAEHEQWCGSARRYLPSVSEPEGVDIVLGRPGGRLRVQVLDADGPVAGARILVDLEGAGRMVGTEDGTLEVAAPAPHATTDRDGRAELLVPERPALDLVVHAPGRAIFSERVPASALGEELRVELPPPATLRGTCVDAVGLTVRNAHVEVVQAGGLVRREAHSDAHGKFVVTGLSAGDYVVRAREEPPGNLSARYEGTLGDHAELLLELDRSVSLFGTVLDQGQPLAGARVRLFAARSVPAESDAREALTDELGRFFFGGCAAISLHAIHVFRPGEPTPCSVVKARPGGKAVTCIALTAEHAPIELVLEGPRGSLPYLVDLRSNANASSTLVRDEDGWGRFTSPALPGGEYRVIAWSPTVGTWKLGELVHDPERAEVHRLRADASSTLEVEVLLAPDTLPGDVEVALLVPLLDRFGVRPMRSESAERLLPWSEERQAFAAAVACGEQRIVVRGPGLAEVHRTVVVGPDATCRVSCAAVPGVECTVAFLAAPTGASLGGVSLYPSECVLLEARTPTDGWSVELRGEDARLIEGGFEFDVRLPRATLELSAVTSAPGQKQNFSPRAGSRGVEPGELDVAHRRPRLELRLEGDGRGRGSAVAAERQRPR